MKKTIIFVLLCTTLLPLAYNKQNSYHLIRGAFDLAQNLDSIERLLLFSEEELKNLEAEWLSTEETLVTTIEKYKHDPRVKQKLVKKIQSQQDRIEKQIEEVEALIKKLEKQRNEILNPELIEPEEIIIEENLIIDEPITPEPKETVAIHERTTTEKIITQERPLFVNVSRTTTPVIYNNIQQNPNAKREKPRVNKRTKKTNARTRRQSTLPPIEKPQEPEESATQPQRGNNPRR